MGLRRSKSKSLRTIFIKYILYLGVFLTTLMLVYYLIFGIASIGVYPANYSERIIQKNYDELKNSPKVNMDLLTPMCSFGVYSEAGDFLYGNFPVKYIDKGWGNYRQGINTIGLSDYIISIEREEEVLIISYPLSMQFKNDGLRKTLPNAELTIIFSFLFQLLILIILWSSRLAKSINSELRNLLNAVEKIEEQNLDFDVGVSSIEDINLVLQGIDMMKISTQVLPRDLHAEYFSAMALIATSIEKFATEIRGLQKSETREVEEFFAKGQKGSSAMPHKRNPIGSENMAGLARVVRGHMVTAYENVSLWHERDISHSSAERIIIPDTTILIDYMLNRFGNIVKNLTVFPENMKRNMNATFGLIYSQRVMLKLIDHGMTREQAYDLVQPKTAQAWDEQTDFRPLLEADPAITEVLTKADLDDAFDYNHHLKQVDTIFERVGLAE